MGQRSIGQSLADTYLFVYFLRVLFSFMISHNRVATCTFCQFFRNVSLVSLQHQAVELHWSFALENMQVLMQSRSCETCVALLC